jgi:superfamily I DNA/RNA helicase
MPNEYLSSLVTAPAGSGKTTTIVSRYLHELRAGHSPDQVIAITFTRRAAAELVERLEQVLGREIAAELRTLPAAAAPPAAPAAPPAAAA